MMELSAAGLELLKRSEGFRNQMYKDLAGFPTIGYGHRILASESFPGGIDEAQGAELLAGDVRAAGQAVMAYMSNFSPLAVLRPLNTPPYQEAMP